MSIENINVIDGIALAENKKGFILLITDHLDWNDQLSHLNLLQDKINSYLEFIENEQYKEIYPNRKFKQAIIEIRFLYDIPDNCKTFLDSASSQILQLGVNLRYIITGTHI